METGEDVLALEERRQRRNPAPGSGEMTNNRGQVDVQSGNSVKNTSSRRSSRKVSFPDDDSLVKSVEAPDPWKNAGNPTSEDVITAYRNACSRFKVKPCDKLVKQLQACESLTNRIDVIDLRGTKLDLKSCEALEEVFRRVRTKTLDLENTNLEDDATVALLEMVEFYHTTCKLNLAYNNKIKIRGWQAVARTLKKTHCLQYVDMRHTIWTEQSIPLLGRILRLDCPLTVLHMESTGLSGRALFLLASGIKFNHILEDLFLGDNKLVSSDGQCLGAMLKGNSTLKLLDLRNNMLQDMGLGHICEGLAEQHNGGLVTLVLWNNQLSHQGMHYLSNAMVSAQMMQTLNLGHNKIGNEGIHLLKAGLLRNYSLQRLGLLNTRITSEGFIALAEYLADTKSLLRLDLRENDPYVGGLMALALSLKVNQSLVRIDLDKEMKKEPGMETTQRILLADIYSYCQRNKNQSKERELREQQREEDSQRDDESVSEVESILQDVVELPDVEEVSPAESQERVLPVPQLIQLDSPPDVESELKTLVSDYPPSAHLSSRFTITKITENECTSSSSDDESSDSCSPIKEIENFSERTECSLLVDLGSPPVLTSTPTQGLSAAMNMENCPLIDFSSDQNSGLGSNLNAVSKENSEGVNARRKLQLPTSLSVNNAHSTGQSAEDFEKELDDMLTSVKANKGTINAGHVCSTVTSDQDFWTAQVDSLMNNSSGKSTTENSTKLFS